MNYIKSIPDKKRRNIAAGLISVGAYVATLADTSNPYHNTYFAKLNNFQTILFNRIHGDRKRMLFRGLQRKNVIELGAGTGANFKYLPRNCLYSAVEENPESYEILKENAGKHGWPEKVCDIRNQKIQSILSNAPSDSVDSFICTKVLGSLKKDDEYKQVVKEIYRVLKPGGRFYFVENVAATPSTLNSLLQQVYSPIKRFFTKYSIDCQIPQAVKESGFSGIYMELWPHDKDKEDSRQGIVSVFFDEEGSLKGLSGITPLVAGVAMKGKSTKKKNRRKPRQEFDKINFTSLMPGTAAK